MQIRKAIIPVAGLGTRFLPATKAQPKEMLPLVDTPVIQYIVEEAVASGIREIIFVTSVGKRAIEDHFDRNFELEYRLEQKKRNRELAELARIGKLAKFAFVRQQKPLGDGHAILAAAPFIETHEPVAVLFGDDVIGSARPALRQLMDVYERYGDPVIAVKEIARRDVTRFGVIDGTPVDRHIWEVRKVVEKPSRARAPSSLAVVGRYIITPHVLELLGRVKPGADGEIRLAHALEAYRREGQALYAAVLEGRWYDCGNKLQFLEAQVEMGLRHPEIKKEFSKYLAALQRKLKT